MRTPEQKRAYDREYARQRRRLLQPAHKPFVAIDGEGVTLPDGTHKYVLLCASTGAVCYNQSGINFASVARFLGELRQASPGCIMVGFGLNYDINCWLHSLGLDFIVKEIFDREPDSPLPYVKELHQRVYLDWKPGKTFTLGYPKKQGEKGFTVYDVFGFFQSPFARALRDYHIGNPDDIVMIERYKAQRPDFTPDTNIEEMKHYCLKECEYLAQLMERQRDLWEGLGYHLRRWDGAGAGASELLRMYDVKEHNGSVDIGQIPEVFAAFYGGRFEALQLGEIPQAYYHDLHSAYASAMVKLPCLTKSYFQDVRRTAVIADDIAMYHVEWQCGEDCIIGPFPYRTTDDRIVFPTNGEGWYWNVEVAAALERYSDAIRVIECKRLVIGDNDACSCRGHPFAWVQDVYHQRLTLKQAGDMGERPLKLALAACYGKFAQGVGTASYQNFIWAGLITATIRAEMMRAIWRNKADREVVLIATDGLYSRVPLGVQSGPGLGEWECSLVDSVFVAGNGLLRLRCTVCDGEECDKCHGTGWVVKSRGYGKGEHIPWSKLIEAYHHDNLDAIVRVNLNRFIGAQLARHLTDKSVWCTWLRGSDDLEVTVGGAPRLADFATVRVAAPGRIPGRSPDGYSLTTWPDDAPGDGPSKPHTVKRLRAVLHTQEDLNQIVDAELNSD